MIEHETWESFRPWFASNWRAGEHVMLLGPTGRGKSYLASAILDLRRYVVALDLKGGTDPSLQRLGFVRLTTWPHPKERQLVRKGEPLRVLLSPPNDKPEQLPVMRETFRTTLDDVFTRGGWSVYVDEAKTVGAPFHEGGMGLHGEMNRLILMGRSRGTSVICSAQAPRWVPPATYDQAVHCFFWRNRDHRMALRLAEISGGNDRREILSAVSGLGFHDVLYVGGRQERMVITRAA